MKHKKIYKNNVSSQIINLYYSVGVKKFITPRLKLEMLETDITYNGSEFYMSTIRLKKLNLNVFVLA